MKNRKECIKKIRKNCIYGIKVCLCFFISWSFIGFIFGRIRTDDGYLFSSPIICFIIIFFMYITYYYEKKFYEMDYKVKF